ncbi:DUF1365 domain-containing protein [Hyphomonas sp.]|uniref:DUF1365 domain-containing protein n=1 Tax=Hyphomonas sp. TaxID=87 RepID=UPI0035284DB3
MNHPARYYVGQVSHRRFGKITHVLRYRIAYLLLDLDRLEEVGRLTKLLKIGKRGLVRFDPLDHGKGETTDLAAWVRAFVARQGVQDDVATIELLTLPRMFGYVFNPISVYFLRDRAGDLHHILYEVGNTFGERHFYLCAADQKKGLCRHECEKAFYVSPFFDQRGQYEFTVQPPSENVALAISYQHGEEKRMSAHLAGKACSVTAGTTIGLLAKFPFMTIGVIAGIHWEAFKLVLKGARYHRRGSERQVPGVSLGRAASNWGDRRQTSGPAA